MTAFCTFLMAISFVMAFLHFFPHWKPDSPEWLGTAYSYFANIYTATSTFLLGFGLLYLFG